MNLLNILQNIQHWILDNILLRCPWIGLDKRAEAFVKLFENDLKPDSMVLDIGGGPGFYFKPIRDRGHWITLLDVRQYKCCPGFIAIYDGKTIPFMDRSINASLLITVLHHTTDPVSILREAKRVSSDHVIVIEDIYETFFGKIIAVLRDAVLNFEYFGHPMNFKKKTEWEALFKELGFTVERSLDFHSHLMGMPIRTGFFLLKP